MDLSEIPFDVPIIIWSIRKEKSLQNPLGSKLARCPSDNRDINEQLCLRRVLDDKVAIQSVRNGRYLQVRTNGECIFDPKEPGDWELFTMETDSEGALYFVSCHTGDVLRCNDNYSAVCSSQNRQDKEAWRIVEPRASATTIQAQQQLDQRNGLASSDRQHLVLELAKCGKTPDEIEQIVTRLFDVSLATVSAPPLVLHLDKA